MELKDTPGGLQPPLKPSPESIQWNWKWETGLTLLTYLMLKESIQWNWKVFRLLHVGGDTLKSHESIQWNWKRNCWCGYQRPNTQESIQWNWKNLINSQYLWLLEWNPYNGIERGVDRGAAAIWQSSLWIHTMELKDILFNNSLGSTPIFSAESIQWNWKRRRAAEEIPPEEKESIQWNWKLLYTFLLLDLCIVCLNPYNGIERYRPRLDLQGVGRGDRIHTMELKVVYCIYSSWWLVTVESIQWNWK